MDPRIQQFLAAAMQARGGRGGGGAAPGGFFMGPQGQVFEDFAGSEEDDEGDDEDEEIDLSEYLPKPLEDMTIAELKDECKKRDLAITGSRKALQSRIMDDIEQEHMRKGLFLSV